MQTTNNKPELISTIFKAVAVAMGVAVIVMGTLGALLPATADALLGVGLTALALTVLQRK
jgi:hypothetical protein